MLWQMLGWTVVGLAHSGVLIIGTFLALGPLFLSFAASVEGEGRKANVAGVLSILNLSLWLGYLAAL